MNAGLALGREYKRSLKNNPYELAVCPDFLALPGLSKIFAGGAIALGAQDCGPEKRGALTGEISVADLAELGVRYVIIGHSERRQKLGESNDLIRAKLAAAYQEKIIPILCVGESLTEKEAGQTEKVLSVQLTAALKDLPGKKPVSLLIAYEPIWAIGTGEPIMPVEANNIHLFLKRRVQMILGKSVRVIYGGSVSAANAALFLQQPAVDGLLIGGASLCLEEFVSIVQKYK